MFRKIRIVILLLILASVALSAWRTTKGAHNWRSNQFVGLYPINADGSPVTTAYLKILDQDAFLPIQKYMTEEMQRHGLNLPRALTVQLEPEIKILPPPMPANASWWQNARWSLEIRWWAWRNTPKSAPMPEVRLYLLYHDPDQTAHGLHSVGLSKGRIGIVNLYAARHMEGSNQVVTTHEMLHTFGASDKYDLNSLQPIPPQGLAHPARSPLYPQEFAEIMAGRIARSANQAEMPRSLWQTLIGAQTAQEIGWLAR